MNCKEIIIFLVLSYQPKKNSLSVCGAALAVSERTSQKYIHNATYKRQTEHFYLADIDKQAQERTERLTAQMKRAQGITEQLKTENALEWIGQI